MFGLFLRLSLLLILCRQATAKVTLEITGLVEQGETATLTWTRGFFDSGKFEVKKRSLDNKDPGPPSRDERGQVVESNGDGSGTLIVDFPTQGTFVLEAIDRSGLFQGSIIATSNPIQVQPPNSGPNPPVGPPGPTRPESTPGTTPGESTESNSTSADIPSNTQPSQSPNDVPPVPNTSFSPDPFLPAPTHSSEPINGGANTSPISSGEALPTGGSAQASGNSSSNGSNTGIIVGCVIGGLILLLLGVLVFLYLRRQRQRRELEESAERFSNYTFPVSVRQNLDEWTAARPELHHPTVTAPTSIPSNQYMAPADRYGAQYDGYGIDEKVAIEERPGYGFDAHPEWQGYDQNAATSLEGSGYGYGYGYGQEQAPDAANYASTTTHEHYKQNLGVGSEAPKPYDGIK